MMIASESIEVDSASEVVSLTVWNLGARAATREHTTRAIPYLRFPFKNAVPTGAGEVSLANIKCSLRAYNVLAPA